MFFAYECPCCGEGIVVPNPFDVTCPCCGERSGMSLSRFLEDKEEEDNERAKEETK